jgi:excisionase family DNA binding protein
MSTSVNKVTLLGNLGQEPELKTLTAGATICNLSVATNEQWIDEKKGVQERVEWLSPADAAKLLNVGVKRVYQWLKDNSLGHYRFGPREVRISSAQLQAFVDAQLRATQH